MLAGQAVISPRLVTFFAFQVVYLSQVPDILRNLTPR